MITRENTDEMKVILGKLGITLEEWLFMNTMTLKLTKAFNTELFENVTDILKDLKIPMHLKGYEELREAIIMTYKNPKLIESPTKSLYPEVAKNFFTDYYRVERNIRHVIETSAKYASEDTMKKYLGYTYTVDSRPTNSLFILKLVDYLKNLENRSIEISESMGISLTEWFSLKNIPYTTSFNKEQLTSSQKVLDEVTLKSILHDIFADLGIPAKLSGYNYLRSVIIKIYKRSDYNFNVRKTIYTEAARELGISLSSLERCIRTAIDASYKNCIPEVRDKYFKYSVPSKTGKLSPTEFITGLVKYLESNITP